MLVASLQSDPDLKAGFCEHHLEPLTAHLHDLVRRAQHRGGIDPGDQVERLAEILIGAWLYRLLLVPSMHDLERDMRAMLHALLRRPVPGGAPAR